VTHNVAAGVFAIGPGHGLYDDAALGAIDPPHGIAEEYADIPQRNETKQTRGQVIISRPGFTAFRTAGFAVGPCRDLHN